MDNQSLAGLVHIKNQQTSTKNSPLLPAQKHQEQAKSNSRTERRAPAITLFPWAGTGGSPAAALTGAGEGRGRHRRMERCGPPTPPRQEEEEEGEDVKGRRRRREVVDESKPA